MHDANMTNAILLPYNASIGSTNSVRGVYTIIIQQELHVSKPF